MDSILMELKETLKDFKIINEKTYKGNENVKIDYMENPLNPNLLSYCFKNVLGFEVYFRIAEKVNYIIEFDYKSTYAKAEHKKMSYAIYVDEKYKTEIIEILENVKSLLEQIFTSIGEHALLNNKFYMKNEAPEYFEKINFLENKIEQLNRNKNNISKKLNGQFDEIKQEGYIVWRPKGSDYLHKLNLELIYNIEAYIDTFYSALEHVLTLLFPFTNNFLSEHSYYKSFIRNTRWAWDAKVNDVCKNIISDKLFQELRRVKEVYRNHNAHGGFSREMMAYVQITDFGAYPLYIGKNYLKGFLDNDEDKISYEMYERIKEIFNEFWTMLKKNFEIPMMIIDSGLPIPVDTKIYMENIKGKDDAELFIQKQWYDIDNQSNMDW
ncbi:MAG: hypothetical protein E7284_05860 [Lachnospiraceae bacterium]|nr:hypothetical protein [Lachnospiraceae bacterium]